MMRSLCRFMKHAAPIVLLLITLSCTKKIVPEILPEDEQQDSVDLPSDTKFSAYLGVNAFEWDFVQPNSPWIMDEAKFSMIKSFSGIRHYLDWSRIEPSEGQYTFSPSHAGSWEYDMIYQRMKDFGLEVLVDLKTCPAWLLESYPPGERDVENVPAPYGLNRNDPASYIAQARAAFQMAARYGYNKDVNPALVKVNPNVRWFADPPNVVKIGLGLVSYIECDNERDKWWKGPKAQQNPEEYAANLSAFYDGHKGTLGANVGVKTADPAMKVVMGGLAHPDPQFVMKMVEWCRKNRGTKADGSVDLCFDIINYHQYSNNASTNGGIATVGVAPERSDLGQVAEDFVKMAKEHAGGLPVWVTETGYDVNPNTPQRAIEIGSKSAMVTQADWNLRTSLLYARKGIKKCIFYMLYDVNIDSWTQYSSSGFVNADMTRRPSGDYILQTKKLIGEASYTKTLSTDPIVDLYKQYSKEIYVAYIPDQTGRTATYEINLGKATKAIIYTLQIGKNEMLAKTVDVVNGKLNVEISETPIFIEKI